MIERPTHARRAAILAAIGALVVVALVLPPPEPTRFWDSWFDAGHVPLSGALALLFRRLLARRAEPTASLAALGLTVLAGVGVEVLQMLQPAREASLGDVANDVAGAAAFLLLRHAWHQHTTAATVRGRRVTLLATVGVLLLVAALTPHALVMAAYAARSASAPVLYPFEGRWWESYFAHGEGARLTPGARPAPASGRTYTRVDFDPAPYSSVVMEEPAGDWTSHRRLVFDLFSDSATALTLYLRIHDRAHVNRHDDRYNATIVVRPGVNVVSVAVDAVRDAPATRSLDLRAIRGIILFAAGLRAPAHVFIGPVRLE